MTVPFGRTLMANPGASVWSSVQAIIMAIAFYGNQIRPHTDYSSNAGQNYLATVATSLP